MKILFLGQNPSTVAPNSVFVNTKSGKFLEKLIDHSGIPKFNICYHNCVSTHVTPPRSEFARIGKDKNFSKILSEYELVYVCGNLAKVAVDVAKENFLLHRVTFVNIPHPSPRNRFWNDVDSFKNVSNMIRLGYESAFREKMGKVLQGVDTSSGVDR